MSCRLAANLDRDLNRKPGHLQQRPATTNTYACIRDTMHFKLVLELKQISKSKRQRQRTALTALFLLQRGTPKSTQLCSAQFLKKQHVPTKSLLCGWFTHFIARENPATAAPTLSCVFLRGSPASAATVLCVLSLHHGWFHYFVPHESPDSPASAATVLCECSAASDMFCDCSPLNQIHLVVKTTISPKQCPTGYRVCVGTQTHTFVCLFSSRGAGLSGTHPVQ